MIAKDWPQKLAGYTPKQGAFWYDSEAAHLAIDFFPRFLRHIKGRIAGQPYELNPWERDVVATLFGWKRKDGTRRYREAMIAVPRKNNKTTLCAGLALFTLFCDKEEGAEIYCAAASRDQARMVFDTAANMVRRSPQLQRRAHIVDTTSRIVLQNTASYIRAIAAEATTAHGFNAHTVIMDELHTQPSRELYDVLKTSMGARRQPLMISITTAGHDRESICYEVWDYARKVRDGVVDDPHFLPVIYEADEDDDWTDPKVWEAANPNYGRSVSHDYLEDAFKRATRTPAFENSFKNLHLNQWTESESRWISSEDWRSCEGRVDTTPGAPTFIGIDLASVTDLTAVVAIHKQSDEYHVQPYFFCPSATVQNAPKRHQAAYRQWVNDGYITVTEGSATDYGQVRVLLEQLCTSHDVRCIAADPWQAQDTLNWLEANGMPAMKVNQTFGGLWPGVKAVEEAIADHKIVHDGNPVLRWMIDSTVVDMDGAGNRKPNKRKSQGDDGTKGKIDGVVAMCMAMGEASQQEADVLPAIY
jgi:phage terminase large subunit-like protein